MLFLSQGYCLKPPLEAIPSKFSNKNADLVFMDPVGPTESNRQNDRTVMSLALCNRGLRVVVVVVACACGCCGCGFLVVVVALWFAVVVVACGCGFLVVAGSRVVTVLWLACGSSCGYWFSCGCLVVAGSLVVTGCGCGCSCGCGLRHLPICVYVLHL
jgi:hypothetical protein